MPSSFRIVNEMSDIPTMITISKITQRLTFSLKDNLAMLCYYWVVVGVTGLLSGLVSGLISLLPKELSFNVCISTPCIISSMSFDLFSGIFDNWRRSSGLTATVPLAEPRDSRLSIYTLISLFYSLLKLMPNLSMDSSFGYLEGVLRRFLLLAFANDIKFNLEDYRQPFMMSFEFVIIALLSIFYLILN